MIFWPGLDRIYRFYYQSWKVYALQGMTQEIAQLLAAIAPEGRPFCAAFQELLDAGVGEVRFEAAHNQAWTQHTDVGKACKFKIRISLRSVNRLSHNLIPYIGISDKKLLNLDNRLSTSK
jgi:hypothetical protein